MLRQIISIIMVGVTILAETYILKFENLRALHGIHYFLDLFLMVALPVITTTLLLYSFVLKKEDDEKEEGKKKEEPIPYAELHSKALSGLISDNLPLRIYLESSLEQIDRFEKKIQKIRQLCQKRAYQIDMETFDNTQQLFYSRMKELEDICDVFDSTEYKKFHDGQLRMNDPSLVAKKNKFFQELMQAARAIINQNEDLILKLDEVIRTLYEVSNDTSWNANSLIAVNELEDFVRKSREDTELSKDAHRKVAEGWRKSFSSDY